MALSKPPSVSTSLFLLAANIFMIGKSPCVILDIFAPKSIADGKKLSA